MDYDTGARGTWNPQDRPYNAKKGAAAAARASFDRGLAGVSEGRVKPLEQYERERGP
jgi:hypothetical protein